MGTDIHLYVERREDKYDRRWHEAGRAWDLMMHESVAWGDRNYNVFAVLADVRNGRGFAGVPTSEGFNIIAPPRGLPGDMSPEMCRHADANLEHTPSWLTLKEVLDFNWCQIVTQVGVVSAAEYKVFKEKGKPESWCGDITGRYIRKVPPSEMETLIEAASADLDRVYTRVEWDQTYEDVCKGFLDWCRGLVRQCGYANAAGDIWRANSPRPEEYSTWVDSGPFAYTEPEDVRFVFWFDS